MRSLAELRAAVENHKTWDDFAEQYEVIFTLELANKLIDVAEAAEGTRDRQELPEDHPLAQALAALGKGP